MYFRTFSYSKVSSQFNWNFSRPDTFWKLSQSPKMLVTHLKSSQSNDQQKWPPPNLQNLADLRGCAVRLTQTRHSTTWCTRELTILSSQFGKFLLFERNFDETVCSFIFCFVHKNSQKGQVCFVWSMKNSGLWRHFKSLKFWV